MDVHRAIEQAARDSYGRLIAFLAVRRGDVAAFEDALSDAFVSALETWPLTGVPNKPEAWLLTAARRRLIDGDRRARVRADAAPALLALAEEAQQAVSSGFEFPDERLQMLFLCAHPSIDPAIHTPLMLQTVLGIDAARIASAFLVKPSAMGQRLSRAKAKIRGERLTFEMPGADELPQRLDPVLEAIYAAYGSGWDDAAGADPRRNGLTEEAICLARLLARSLPEEPEPHGLLALLLHCEARRAARRDRSGEYVPLSEQDPALWSRPLIEEAEQHLRLAAQAGRIGRFQLEAAIQSAHAQRIQGFDTEWEAIALLYEGLVHLAPTIGTLVGRAAAVAEARGPEAGLALLEEIPTDSVKSYQPYWAVAAHFQSLANRLEEAREAYGLAIGLCADPAVKKFLIRQSRQLGEDWF
ncbi:RNA polymerase subunit sigma-70 [Cohnella sp. CBP 2801]|uniref:RNA polymerase subunit sigma-70 n=1 Tax=Cohnella zeiphila TaxID=2761120 RepID=A0A7X0SR47_9BACL|nr:RNA polymerase subunit sigma-70 [Cohnella zeiphila]